MRVKALAPWKTTLVCMVPPCVGNGCANTTAARGAPAGASISASSRPAGPAISRTGSANSPPGIDVCRVLLDEPADHGCEFVGPGDDAQVTGAANHGRGGVSTDGEVLVGHCHRHHPVEMR